MTVEIITPPALARWRDIAKPEFRQRMFAAIADRVENLVRRHLLRIAPAHHNAANRLGATPTGHIERGARTTVANSSAEFAEVVIPIAGISRAFKDLSIVPRNAAYLTIPIAPQAYGKRVARMRQLGWMIFRPKGRDVLMGAQKDQEAIPLYCLKKRVDQRQDRTLLPGDDEIGSTAAAAITGVIDHVTKGAA